MTAALRPVLDPATSHPATDVPGTDVPGTHVPGTHAPRRTAAGAAARGARVVFPPSRPQVPHDLAAGCFVHPPIAARVPFGSRARREEVRSAPVPSVVPVGTDDEAPALAHTAAHRREPGAHAVAGRTGPRAVRVAHRPGR